MAAHARAERLVLSIGAALVIALLCARSLLRCDSAWDTWAYHLPFAARLWDIVPRASFEMDDHLEVLFRSYPVGVEWLQGALWKLTGRVQAANLVSLGSLLAFIELLSRRFAVSRSASVFALLAIPMVQIHATAAYVDLPANVAAASGVLLSFRAWTAARPEPSDAPAAALCAAFAAASKFQMAPIAALVAFSLALCLAVRREARTSTGMAVLAFSVLFGAYPYLRNAVVFGFPFFPLSLPSLWRSDTGSLLSYEGPAGLAHWPGAARWLMSVLGSGELDPARGMFSVDSVVDQVGAPTSLMGGYFGPWVACQLVFLWRLNRSSSRVARGALCTVALLTLLVAVSPQSHQLRYYAFWMLVLVALNLTRAATLPAGESFGCRTFTYLALLAFALVVLLTQGRFLEPGSSSRPVARFVEERVPTAVLRRLRAGGRYCLIGETSPPLALSAELLGRGAYALKSSKHVDQCGDREVIWMTHTGEPLQ